MTTARNPILSGFYPDPSICRVGEDFYLVNSSFAYFPGVPVFHSKDLAHWEQIGNILEREEQLPLTGCEISRGIFAPTIRYHEGTWYMITTNVDNGGNFIVTAKDPAGPWSDPHYLGDAAPGIDPSLFFDEDGRCYYVGTRPNPEGVQHNGDWEIWMQEVDLKEMKLCGESMAIWKGALKNAIWPEGPHLYKKDGWYYLMTAEGGTGYAHGVSLARSKNLLGPYEPDPKGLTITTRHLAGYGLQKAGHGSLIQAANGRWYVAHLCGRPLGEKKRCVLGRETSLTEVIWKDGWLRTADGTNRPPLELEIPDAEGSALSRNMEEEFDKATWSIHLQSLRAPLGDRASLTERPGWLRLYGAECPNSTFRQSMLAHRQQSFVCEAETKLEFDPKDFQHMAGLTYFYNTQCYYYLYVTKDELLGRVLTLICCDSRKGRMPMGAGIQIPEEGPVWMKISVDYEKAWFSYSLDGTHFETAGPKVDATILSDDYFEETGHCMFTGAFFGICCQDLAGDGCFADFDYFHYHEKE